MPSMWSVEHLVKGEANGCCPRCGRPWSMRTHQKFKDGHLDTWREHCTACGVQWECHA